MEHVFDVSGGKVIVADITMESDQIGLVFEFKADAECSESSGCDGRTAAEWKGLYERELAAHRENVLLLHQAEVRANIAESKLRDVSKSFMELHNICKDVVGPKRVPGMQSPVSPGFPSTDRDLPARAQIAKDGADF